PAEDDLAVFDLDFDVRAIEHRVLRHRLADVLADALVGAAIAARASKLARERHLGAVVGAGTDDDRFVVPTPCRAATEGAVSAGMTACALLERPPPPRGRQLASAPGALDVVAV